MRRYLNATKEARERMYKEVISTLDLNDLEQQQVEDTELVRRQLERG